MKLVSAALRIGLGGFLLLLATVKYLETRSSSPVELFGHAVSPRALFAIILVAGIAGLILLSLGLASLGRAKKTDQN